MLHQSQLSKDTCRFHACQAQQQDNDDALLDTVED